MHPVSCGPIDPVILHPRKIGNKLHWVLFQVCEKSFFPHTVQCLNAGIEATTGDCGSSHSILPRLHPSFFEQTVTGLLRLPFPRILYL